MQKYKTAVIGIGADTQSRGSASAIAYAHGWAYQENPQCDLVAACTRTAKKRLDFMKEMGISNGYEDYEEMLSKERIDILSICTYPESHLEIVKEAAAAGIKIIWLEKPMAYSLSECKELVDICDENGVTLAVNHILRAGEPFKWGRKAIEDGKIGIVRNVQITTNYDWWNNLYDVGIHDFDIVRFMLGDPVAKEIFAQVECSGEKKYKDGKLVEDRCLASILLENNVRVIYDCSACLRNGESHIRIAGSDGFIELYFEKPEKSDSVIRASLIGEKEIIFPQLDEDYFGSPEQCGSNFTRLVLADLIDSYEKQREPLCSGRNTCKSMEIITGILVSAYQKKTVQMPVNNLFESDGDLLNKIYLQLKL